MKLSNLGSFLTPIVTIIRAKGVTNSLTHSLLGGDVIHGQPFSLIVYKRKKRCFIEIHGKTIFLILDSKLTFSSWFIYFVRHILIAQFLAIHDLLNLFLYCVYRREKVYIRVRVCVCVYVRESERERVEVKKRERHR